MPPSASEVAASDAGPLMALGTLDRLDLLACLFRRTLVAQAVLDECLARPGAADARAIRAECVKQIAIHSRGRACGRETGLLLGSADIAQARLPKFLSILGAQSRDKLILQPFIAERRHRRAVLRQYLARLDAQ